MIIQGPLLFRVVPYNELLEREKERTRMGQRDNKVRRCALEKGMRGISGFTNTPATTYVVSSHGLFARPGRGQLAEQLGLII